MQSNSRLVYLVKESNSSISETQNNQESKFEELSLYTMNDVVQTIKQDKPEEEMPSNKFNRLQYLKTIIDFKDPNRIIEVYLKCI